MCESLGLDQLVSVTSSGAVMDIHLTADQPLRFGYNHWCHISRRHLAIDRDHQRRGCRLRGKSLSSDYCIGLIVVLGLRHRSRNCIRLDCNRHRRQLAYRLDHALLDVPRCRHRGGNHITADSLHPVYRPKLVLSGHHHRTMEGRASLSRVSPIHGARSSAEQSR